MFEFIEEFIEDMNTKYEAEQLVNQMLREGKSNGEIVDAVNSLVIAKLGREETDKLLEQVIGYIMARR